MTTVTLISDDQVHDVEGTIDGEAIRVRPDIVERTLGWHLEASGLCRGDVCVPVRDRARLTAADGIDLGELARVLDRPFASDAAERVAVLGESAVNRSGALSTLTAPDFELPDLAGRKHHLSDHRGKKRLLIAWASW